jgi:hypothetical protein
MPSPWLWAAGAGRGGRADGLSTVLLTAMR